MKLGNYFPMGGKVIDFFVSKSEESGVPLKWS